MKLQDIVKHKRIACPDCKKSDFEIRSAVDNQILRCNYCLIDFNVVGDIALMVPPSLAISSSKEDIQKFWGELFEVAYSKHNENYTDNNYLDHFRELRNLFQHREHLAVVEMPIDNLEGVNLLEIGPGAGAHSSLFCLSGAQVTSLDITLDRVVETNRKLELVDSNNTSFAIQGDAEQLPFTKDNFDIVYSNGVLHHTPNTAKAVKEVLRVLKPGGRAIIMLYARHSFLYWINLFFLKGLLLGNLFRHSNDWLGRTTEWMSTQKQEVYNPETKVYSGKDILNLFEDFSDIKIRKNSFAVQQIPLIGKWLSPLIGKFTGYNQAGFLVYDSPWRNESKMELWLGSFIGFGLNITAVKK